MIKVWEYVLGGNDGFGEKDRNDSGCCKSEVNYC